MIVQASLFHNPAPFHTFRVKNSNIERPGAFPQNVVNKNTVLRLNIHFFYFCLLRWKWLSVVTAKIIFENLEKTLDIYFNMWYNINTK